MANVISLSGACAYPAVVDIERLRLVVPEKGPNDSPTCDVLVVGGGLGGVAAAEVLADQGVSVYLAEQTSHLGGQLTVEGESVPDENKFIEEPDGPGTRRYRELRAQVRAYYARLPGIEPGRWKNVGDCWNSVISGEPDVWEQAIKERIASLEGPRGIRRVMIREALVDIHRYPGNGKISYVDLVSLDDGRMTRVGARFVLDATETGDALAMAGSPWTIGQEARSEYSEPDAPALPEPGWVQSFTYCFDLRLDPRDAGLDTPPPTDYDLFKSFGQYSLVYRYPTPLGDVKYDMFDIASDRSYGPFWSYRRIVASSSFDRSDLYPNDISLIDWSGNDYCREGFVGRSPEDELRVLHNGRDFAKGFLYWLRTECPRDNGGYGYPELVPAGDVLGGDGIATFPYVRESRRLLAKETLTENDMIDSLASSDTVPEPDLRDSVGIAWYPIDVHPALGEPPHLMPTRPYELPFGAFVPRSGPTNIIPAAADFGASRLAMASARVHPVEWLAGEIAAHIAVFCLKQGVEPEQIREDPSLLSEFQAALTADGINISWQGLERSGPTLP